MNAPQLMHALMSACTDGMVVWCMDEKAIEAHLFNRAELGRAKSLASADRLLSHEGAAAIIDVRGVLTPRAEWLGETSTVALAEAIRMAATDENVTGTVLRIDSPGGYAVGMLELAEAIAEAKAAKPIVAHCPGGYMCSAAYWIAAECTAAYAEPLSRVGSIGTRIHLFEFKGLFDNLGIRSIPIDTGPYKSTGAFGTELTADQQAYVKTLVDDCQQHFTAAVMAGRKFTDEQFAAVSDGRIFPVADALALGLIDGVQKFSQTLAALPRRESKPSQSRSPKTMSETNDAASHKELKAALPTASADFILGQLEAEATIGDALKAFNEHLSQQLAEERARAEEAEKKAAAATAPKSKPAPSASTVRGNRHVANSGDVAGEDENVPVNYVAMAQQLAKERNITFRAAAMEVKRRYPEARDGFKGDPLGK